MTIEESFKELTPKLKQLVDYLVLTKLEDLKKEYDESYEKKVYIPPKEIDIKGFPLAYKIYILEELRFITE